MPVPSANGEIRGVLFDWDGTLVNSYHADSSAYLAMFREMGIPWTLDDLARHYSPNWYRVYRAAKLPRTRWDDADRAWRKQYAKHRPKLMPGARRVLKHLCARHELGVVTIFFVLDAQTKLAQAQSDLLQAKISYQIAVAAVEHATGGLLQPYNIQVAELSK